MADDNQIQLLTIVIGFAGVIIGALLTGAFTFLSSHVSYLNQSKNELRNIAKAIDIDLGTIYESPFFNEYYKSYIIDKENNVSPSKHMIIPQNSFIEERSLYSIFIHDISKLDYDLSSEIYEFYNDLYQADKYSMFIYQNTTKYQQLFKENTSFQEATFNDYKTMTCLIIKCKNDIPKLREKLKKVYGS